MSSGSGTAPEWSFAAEAFEVAAVAYARVGESWEHAIQAAIGGLFQFLAERAAETRACIADSGTTPAALDRRDRAIERFTTLLQPGFLAAADAPPPVVAEAIGGGIYELIRSHVLEQRLEQLPSAAPDATIVVLAPFLGAEGAIELASTTNVQVNR